VVNIRAKGDIFKTMVNVSYHKSGVTKSIVGIAKAVPVVVVFVW
jgi:hypothetical protein